jgi:hypothetical protein
MRRGGRRRREMRRGGRRRREMRKKRKNRRCLWPRQSSGAVVVVAC